MSRYVRAEDLPLARLAILVLILAILVPVKFSFHTGTGPYGFDGSFYVNAARNVHEGLGLKTNVSLYHYGLTHLPAPSRHIYPLWPLLIAQAARFIGFYEAVDVLPKLLYLLDLILVYFLVNAVCRTMSGDDGTRILMPAHWIVLLLGLNYAFFLTTTYPYTEALGFGCAFSALLLVDRVRHGREAMWSAASAVAAGLALLTRNQMIVIGVGIGLTLIWFAMFHLRYRTAAASFVMIFGAFVAFWYFAVYAIDSGPRADIPIRQVWYRPQSIAEYVGDRLTGIAVSLWPLEPNSYFALFGPVFILVPLASVIALVRHVRSEPRAWRPPAASVATAASIVVACGFYASLNLYHHDNFFVEWVFGARHGLPLVFAIIPAVTYVASLGRGMRAVALVLCSLSVAYGANGIMTRAVSAVRPSPTPAEARLIVWLEKQRPAPILLTTRSQHLSVYTHSGIHWMACDDPPRQTRIMLQRLPIDYVIVYPDDLPCRFLEGLGDVFESRYVFGSDPEPITVLVPRRPRPVPALRRGASEHGLVQ